MASSTATLLSKIPPSSIKIFPNKSPKSASPSSSILVTSSSIKEHSSRQQNNGRWVLSVAVPQRRRTTFVAATEAASSSSESPTAPAPGLYSAQTFELTSQNVDTVLDDVRPYLIADGGNVDVVSVEDGIISLKLQGACGSCPSSTTTMKMGIEKVLKEKFGNAVKDIRQVYDEIMSETTVEAVNSHLDILRPAIKNFGGSVEVLSVEGADCHVKYEGPESIGSGVKAAIKEKFQDIVNVVFTS